MRGKVLMKPRSRTIGSGEREKEVGCPPSSLVCQCKLLTRQAWPFPSLPFPLPGPVCFPGLARLTASALQWKAAMRRDSAGIPQETLGGRLFFFFSLIYNFCCAPVWKKKRNARKCSRPSTDWNWFYGRAPGKLPLEKSWRPWLWFHFFFFFCFIVLFSIPWCPLRIEFHSRLAYSASRPLNGLQWFHWSTQAGWRILFWRKVGETCANDLCFESFFSEENKLVITAFCSVWW